MRKRIFSLRLLLLTVSVLMCLYQTSGQVSIKTAEKMNFIKLKKFSCIDLQGTGNEAFTMLIPAEWKFEGGINWLMESPVMPGVVECRVSDPAGTGEFEIHRDRVFFWTNDNTTLNFYPIGSHYLGSVVMPPMNALEIIKQVILPQERYDCQNLKIESEKDLPELPAMVGTGGGPLKPTDASGAKIRISYVRNGQPIEEDIFSVVEVYTHPVQSMYGNMFLTNWTSKFCFSFKASKGKLDASKKLFETMMSSFRLNQKWFAQYTNFTKFLAEQQIQRSNRAAATSAYISKMNDEVTSTIRQSYESRNKTYDKVFQNWSDATLGVARYNDPYGSEVTLPGGYSHVWGNKNGEYILTDNPNNNPNLGSNIDWVELGKK